MNFLRTPFVTSDTVFKNVLPAMMKRKKIQLHFYFRLVTYNTTQCLKPSITH